MRRLPSGTAQDARRGAGVSARYTDAQLSRVRELAASGLTDRQVAERLSEEWGRPVNRNSVSMLRRDHGIPTGLQTVDRDGNVVSLPPGTPPLLSERPLPSGYVEIKVRYLRQRRSHDMWIQRGVFVWEQHNGQSLPDGMRVLHANGVRDDDRPENLVACTVREYAVIIGKGWSYHDRESLEARIDMAKVWLAANDAEDAVRPGERKRRISNESYRRRRERERG